MNKKILIVDDNKNNIRLLYDILQDEGYTVVAAENGLSAVEIATYVKPDAVLLDIMMPRMDGFQVCELLKKHEETNNIPILMITAKTEASDIKKAFDLGAVDYIKKPFDEADVLVRLNSAVKSNKTQEK